MLRNISKIVLILLMIVVCASANAQTTDTLSDSGQQEMMYRETWISDPHDRMVSLKDLLKSGLITNENYQAAIYTRMAETLEEMNSDKLMACDLEDSLSADCKALFDEIFALYDSAMKKCEFCMPNHIKSRYELESAYSRYEEQAKKDFDYLKSRGYKEERNGFAVGINYTKAPKNDYIGIELSPIGFFQPVYRMRSLDKKTGKMKVVNSNEVPFNFQSFTCGFNKNITRQGYEVWFSAGQMTSPLMINPWKFGFAENYVSGEKVHWFYRPGIGLGWGFFSVNCDYNLVFKKQFRRDDNKWFVTARLSYPIFKYY